MRSDLGVGPWFNRFGVTGIDGHSCLLSDVPDPGEKVGCDLGFRLLKFDAARWECQEESRGTGSQTLSKI
jgi:hypothetical protein